MDQDTARIEALTRRLRELGAPDPEAWARSEVQEGLAQQARFLFLRRLWAEIDAWSAAIEGVPAAGRAISSGADRADLVAVARAAAYEAVFAVLGRLAAGRDDDAPADAPGWSLRETLGEPGATLLTGRGLDALHEDLLGLDPSGREGADLWE